MMFRFGSETAVSFVDNRRALMEALDRDGAPVRLQDIELLEKEIDRAHEYMEKAKRLKEASQRCGEGLPEYDDGITRDYRVCNASSFITVIIVIVVVAVIIVIVT